MNLSFSAREQEGWTVFVVSGEIDLDSGPPLRDALIDALHNGPGRLVIDMSGVTFIDSSGLGVLIGTRRRAELIGGEVRVAAPSERVLHVLRLTGLDHVFALHGSVNEALAAT